MATVPASDQSGTRSTPDAERSEAAGTTTVPGDERMLVEGVVERDWRIVGTEGERRVYTFVPHRARTRGLLVCSPLGPARTENERREVLLARNLAAEGTPVVRFDPRGEGESDGSPFDSTNERYVADAVEAVRILGLASGVSAGAVLGSHAVAAAAVAASRALDGDHLVLWDPVPSGESYRRHLRRATRVAWLSADQSRPLVDRDHGGHLDAFGFAISSPFLDGIAGAFPQDLRGCRVLLCGVATDGTASTDVGETARILEDRGADVAVATGRGDLGWWFHQFRTEERSDIGTWLRTTTAEWLATLPVVDPVVDRPRSSSGRPPAIAPRAPTAFVPVGDHHIRVEATLPSSAIDGAGVVIAWGATYGPPAWRHQSLRHLAARFADLGVPAVRFSWRGVGESTDVNDGFHLADPFTEDLAAACRWLSQFGVARPVVVGQCFGARSALALRDVRPRALVLASVPLRNSSKPGTPQRERGAAEGGLARRFAGVRAIRARYRRGAARTGSRAGGPRAWLSDSFIADLRHHVGDGVPVELIFGRGDPETNDFTAVTQAGLWPFEPDQPGLTTAMIDEPIHSAYAIDGVVDMTDHLFRRAAAVLSLD